MDIYIHRRVQMLCKTERNDVLPSVYALLQHGYATHKRAIDELCGQRIGDLEEVLRDEGLDAIRLQLCDATSKCHHELKDLLHAHLAFVNCRKDSGFPDVVPPLSESTLRSVGGEMVATLMLEYTAVRNLLPAVPVERFQLDLMHASWLDLYVPSLFLPEHDRYTDFSTPQSVNLDRPRGRYTLRSIRAHEGDTAAQLCEHFKCDCDGLKQLNVELVAQGFFVKGARLRRNTLVHVPDYRILDVGDAPATLAGL